MSSDQVRRAKRELQSSIIRRSRKLAAQKPRAPWYVQPYGNFYVAVRYPRIGDTEFLGGWNFDRNRPNRIFATIQEVNEAISQ